MRRLLFIFAVICWTISLVVNLTALIGDYDLSRQFPFIWLLHIGIFVVWLPTIFILRKSNTAEEMRKTSPLDFDKHIKFLKAISKQKPTWLTAIALIGAFYAMINFFLFMISQPGTPEITDGQYILQSHGRLIRTLTESEYNHYLANQIRGFSGHWIAFYGIAAAVLFQYHINTLATSD